MSDHRPPPSLHARSARLRVVSPHDPGGILERVESGIDAIRPRFAPIASLKRGSTAGYEVVFSIGGDAIAAPREWSDDVHPTAAGRLEARLVACGLAERERLPSGAYLALNVSAAGLRSVELREVLGAAGRLDHVVVMVAEDAAEDEDNAAARALEGVREAGGLIAVDEIGSGHASLRHIVQLRPDFVRVGAEFVRDVDRDVARAAVVEAVVTLAARIDAWVMADGIAGRQELSALRRMGVPLGQGPVLGAPTAVMGPLAAPAAAAVLQAAPPVDPDETVAGLVEARPALPWGGSLDQVADAFLEDPRHDAIVLVDERNRPLALAERAALLRGEPYERPVMRIAPTSPLKSVARRAAARPLLERFHPLVACDRRGVYLGIVRVEQLLDALARD